MPESYQGSYQQYDAICQSNVMVPMRDGVCSSHRHLLCLRSMVSRRRENFRSSWNVPPMTKQDREM